MRIWIPAMVAMTTLCAAVPAAAQTYNPAHPFCMRLYSIDGEDVECEYSSLEQCKQSASGRPATCIPNPYFKGAGPASAEPQAPAAAPAEPKAAPKRRAK